MSFVPHHDDPATVSSAPRDTLSRRSFLALLGALSTGMLGAGHLVGLTMEPVNAAPPERGAGRAVPSTPSPRPAEADHIPLAGKPVAPPRRSPTALPEGPQRLSPPKEDDRKRSPGLMALPEQHKPRKPSPRPKR